VGWSNQEKTIKIAMLVAGSAALLFTTLAPDPADAQAGMRRGGYRGGVVRRGPVMRPGYAYRGGYRRGRGWGPAVGLGVLGAAALGAAVAAPYYGYGYADPCLRQQQVYDVYGRIVWQTVRVC
jgi:hypothetical protein